MTALDLLLAALCAYRLTQLVVWDEISEPLVAWIGMRSDWLGRLLGCAHCTGFWCSLFAVILIIAGQRWPSVMVAMWTFAVAGAVSVLEHATGWLEPNEDDEQEDDGHPDDGQNPAPSL